MFRVTALALVIALCNADRRLLQTTTSAPVVQAPVEPVPPVTQPEPPVAVPPTVPVPPVQQPPVPPVQTQPVPPAVPQPRPVQPQPQPRPYNPYCDMMSPHYDYQDCIQYSYAFGGQPAGQFNNNNPFCNPMSPHYDVQDCIQYSYMYGGQGAGNTFGQPQQPQYNPYQQQQPQYNPYAPAAPVNPGFGGQPQGQRPGVPNPMNPYCNPYSGMYDQQDCLQSTMYGIHSI